MNTCEAAQALVSALTKVSNNVYHSESSGEPIEYIVWREAFDGGVRADNRKVENSYFFVVNLFTKIELSPTKDNLCEVFNEFEFAYRDFECIENIMDDYTLYTTTVEVN